MDAFEIIVAVALGLWPAIAIPLIASRKPTLLRKRYFKLLAVATALALGLPLLVFLVDGFFGPFPPRSLIDSYLVTEWHPGSADVLVAYALWVGVALGGGVAFLASVLRSDGEAPLNETADRGADESPTPRQGIFLRFLDKAEKLWPLIASSRHVCFHGPRNGPSAVRVSCHCRDRWILYLA